jgi:hypothetical protein
MKSPAQTILLSLFLVLSGCRDEAVRSALVETPPHIDGDLSEWQNVPVRIFEEKNIAIGALQDSRFLYLAARSADQEINRLIGRRGIMMWIDPDAGERKDLELHYPASGYAMPDPTRGGFWDAMTGEERDRAYRKLEGMRTGVLVIDKRGIDSRIFAPDSSEGFAAASTESKGILTFEVRIPLHPEQYFPAYSPLTGKERIRVGIDLGPLPGSGFSNGSENVGPMGYPGGGRGGFGSRGMLPRRRASTTESDLWVDIMLVK